MIRWIAILSLLALTGCVTTREVVYRDGYYSDGSYSSGRYADSRYRDGGSYYSPSSAGSGDYYYSSPGYYGYSSAYIDYPAYYSVFWPMYRSWHDPYWYPNHYYGVTYFPRNYLSINIGSGWGPRYSSWAYSPYRYSWADNYYDWRPWYGNNYRHRPHASIPRYGSARNEAERLARTRDWSRTVGSPRDARRGSSTAERNTPYGRYGTTRGTLRDASYGSRNAHRIDPGTRGIGVTRGADVRRTGYGSTRQDPGTRGFGVPVERPSQRPSSVRGASYGNPPADASPRGANVQRDYRRLTPSGNRDQLTRYRQGAQTRGTGAPVLRDSSTSSGVSARRGGYSMPRSTPQIDSRSEGVRVTRGYGRPASVGGYDRGMATPAQRSMPAPEVRGYSAPAATPTPQFRSAPAPSRSFDTPVSAPQPRQSAPEARPARSPQFESRGGSRGPSGGGERGNARRVGSRRND